MTKYKLERIAKRAIKYPEQLTAKEIEVLEQMNEIIIAEQQAAEEAKIKEHIEKNFCQRTGCLNEVEEGQNYCSVKCYNGWEDRPSKESNKDLREFTRKFK